jgi:asparagine synthase (glutamine-hydrolysing)
MRVADSHGAPRKTDKSDVWRILRPYGSTEPFSVRDESSYDVRTDGVAALIAESSCRILIVAGERITFQGKQADVAELGYAFQTDAEAALKGLAGAFFTCYLDRLSGCAVVATDRMGTRSPCYSVNGPMFVAGLTAMDVARDAPDLPDLRSQAIFDYFYLHSIAASETIFEGIERLGPGEYLRFESGEAQVHSYWTPRYSHSSVGIAEAETRFRAILRDAVAEQLNGTTTGTFLSGGTDSSTIAGVLAEVAGEAPNTYSIGFDVAGFDELRYARIAAKHFGTRHHEYYLTPRDLLTTIPLVAASYDQPFGNSSVIPAYFCAKLARSDGVGKLLGGDGGDELFGGNSRYARQKVLDAYQALPSWLARGVLKPSLDNDVAGRVPLLSKARSYIQQAVIPMPDRMQTYNLVDRIGPAEIFAPSFLDAVDPGLPANRQRAFYSRCADTYLVNRMLHFDWKYTLADNDLPKVVGACDLAGIAVGFPFLADRMVAFANDLPVDWKVRRLKLRYFFKRALADFLPRDIIVKKKHGFGMPFGHWLTVDAPLRTMVIGSLESLRDREIVQRGFFDELLQKVFSEHAGFYGELVWIMTMLENWLAAHRPGYRFASGGR